MITDTLIQVPVLDMLNHAQDGCVLTFRDDGSLAVKTTRVYTAGEEVHLCYGPDKDISELLASYGIVPPLLGQ